MLEWVKASYSDSQVQGRATIHTLKFVETVGRYHVYKVEDYNLHLVVFDNQPKLRDYIKENVYSALAIKLLDVNNNKYSYVVELDGENTEVYTIARACVIVPGTEEKPANVYTNGRAIYIE